MFFFPYYSFIYTTSPFLHMWGGIQEADQRNNDFCYINHHSDSQLQGVPDHEHDSGNMYLSCTWPLYTSLPCAFTTSPEHLLILKCLQEAEVCGDVCHMPRCVFSVEVQDLLQNIVTENFLPTRIH